MTTGSLAEWNPILVVTSPYPESIISEDADSNNVRSFIRYAREKRSKYMNHPIYILNYYTNEIDMI